MSDISGTTTVVALTPGMADDTVLDGINLLLPTLSRSAPAMTMQYLQWMIDSPQNTTYLAFKGDEHQIVGMATLLVSIQPVGIVCHVEDVVVNPSWQGHGVGEELVRAIIADLPDGWRQCDLTSNPERIAAHRLYEKLGFQIRETGNYRLKPA